MIMLCCVILGGLGSSRGVLLGVFLLIGFDNIIAPILDGLIQKSGLNESGNRFLVFSNWRLMIFGLALILVMRFRPMGLLPAKKLSAVSAQPSAEPEAVRHDGRGLAHDTICRRDISPVTIALEGGK
jgi:branched-chain amino acid transport system permease protein